MAHPSELMSIDDAEALAKAFIELFSTQNGRYFSNGNWHLPYDQIEPAVWAHPGWTPATDATFDGGILALGELSSGCVWFEDED
jgi:cell wall assembly regulator SMI1